MNAFRACLLVLSVALLLPGCRTVTEESDSFAVAMAEEAEKTQKTATHKETAPIGLGGGFNSLSAICIRPDGHLLACDPKREVVHVVSPDGKPVARWEPGLRPQAIAVAADGTVFVGAKGALAKLDGDGKPLKRVESEKGGFPEQDVAAIAVAEKDCFVAFRGKTGFQIYRFDHELAQAKQIVDRLRGCCGTMDIATHGHALYAAENARHRVVKYDREGKVLAKWGKQDRKNLEGFGGCCNPMNICIDRDGVVYTAESGPDRIKRFTADGAYLGMVGWFTGGKSCLCVDIATSKDGDRVYVADVRNNTVRVLAAKPAGEGEQAATGP